MAERPVLVYNGGWDSGNAPYIADRWQLDNLKPNWTGVAMVFNCHCGARLGCPPGESVTCACGSSYSFDGDPRVLDQGHIDD